MGDLGGSNAGSGGATDTRALNRCEPVFISDRGEWIHTMGGAGLA